VDKYLGDAIMALYPDKPENAIKTAISMMRHLEIYNGHRKKVNYKAINIGIGIHTGNLIMGIIGDGDRMQGTVVSDAVNLASRIQDVTKLYGANIIISQDTFVQLENPTDYSFRFLGRVKVKGKDDSVALFEIFDADPDDVRKLKTETKTDFERGILFFAKREFSEAQELFTKIVKLNPRDSAAQLFLEKTLSYIKAGGLKN
jgi:two-component system sensor histidine kinase ChiS